MGGAASAVKADEAAAAAVDRAAAAVVAVQENLSPQEAAEAMTVPPGFQVQLAASEPQIHQPVALAYDHRGRLWVAEALTYPERAPEGQGRDRIVIFEDTDLDGTLDRQTVFVENLNLISGLEVGFGGVWAGAAPYLLFIPDRDGDDRPDGPAEVALDGFGFQDTHETLNSFVWGPDGWLYGCHGVFTHSLVGVPGAAESSRVPLNAGVWRFHPVRREFEAFAWGTSNPWGVDFNDQGQAFITACVIPHLYHVIQGARYQRQAGAHFDPYAFDDIKTIADHVHYAGAIQDHAWWGKTPVTPADTLAAGGGHAHCGAMVYLGDNWPQAYRNRIFFHNVHGNRVNCDVLEPSGSGYVGRHGPDLLVANDRWFRGINLRYGPDGAVHLIDWYDEQACHRRDPELWDRTNGRIYRISCGGRQPVRVDLSRLDDLALAELQAHPNDWQVRTARRLMQHRGRLDAAALGRLRELVADDQPERLQLRGLWALHATGQASEELLLDKMTSRWPYVRGWAVQLALERRNPSAAVVARLAELARDDDSPAVRLFVASALQRLPREACRAVATALIGRAEDADDHNLPLMLWYGIEPLVADDPQWALDLAESAPMPLIRRFIVRRAAAEPRLLPEIVERLPRQADLARQAEWLTAMNEALAGQGDLAPPPTWPAAFAAAVGSGSRELRERAIDAAVLLGDPAAASWLAATAGDAEAPLDRRQQALRGLARLRAAEPAPAAIAALDDPQLAATALQALAAWGDVAIADAILARYERFPNEQRREALQTLVSRPSFARRLLEAIDGGAVPRGDLLAIHVRQLRALQDADVALRVDALWGAARETPDDKQDKIERWKSELAAAPEASPGELAVGRALFRKHCATCHVLFGEGERIGPELTGSNRGNLDYLLENLVDPSALVGRDYQSTLVVTDEGRTLLGLIAAETPTAVTLQTATERIVVPKSQIAVRETSEVSLMPEGILDALQPDELRMLRAYLALTAPLPAAGGALP